MKHSYLIPGILALTAFFAHHKVNTQFRFGDVEKENCRLVHKHALEARGHEDKLPPGFVQVRDAFLSKCEAQKFLKSRYK